jgi:hypothetical protein
MKASKVLPVRLLLGLALLGTLCLAVFAQAPAALEYKFSKGQNLNYLVNFSATGAMTMVPAPAEMPAMTMSLQGNLDLNQQVTQCYADGSADIALKMPRAAINALAMGQKFNAVLQGGKINATVGGEPIQMPPDMDLSQLPFIGVPLTMRMDKLGKVTDFSFPNVGSLTEMMKSSGMDMSSMMKFSQDQLPDHPVAVGDSWTQNLAMPMTPGSPPVQIKVVSTLLGYEGVGGQQAAKIQIKGTGTAANLVMPSPPMPAGESNVPRIKTVIDSMNLNVEGIVWFSPALGQVMKTQQAVTVKQISTMSGMPDGPTKSNLEMRMSFGTILK